MIKYLVCYRTIILEINCTFPYVYMFTSRVILTNCVRFATFSSSLSLSVVVCCYQQIYDIFNMSCPGVILQVRSHDGMFIPQNGATAYSQSYVSRFCQGGFPLPSLRFSSS